MLCKYCAKYAVSIVNTNVIYNVCASCYWFQHDENKVLNKSTQDIDLSRFTGDKPPSGEKTMT